MRRTDGRDGATLDACALWDCLIKSGAEEAPRSGMFDQEKHTPSMRDDRMSRYIGDSANEAHWHETTVASEHFLPSVLFTTVS